MEEKLLLYLEIHQLRKQRLRVTQIAKRLNISRNTVYKYLAMTFEEAVEEFEPITRKRKLDSYRDWIVNWLQEYPSLSSAQILDWLQERFPQIDVGESTVRRYVTEMREIYQIDKDANQRMYEAVDELPPGKQLQVDWGQTVQKTKDKKEIRLYFIAFVLAHSRQKFMIWQDGPFTTQDTIRCHEQAFQFYEGVPEEIVYDQDNLIAVSENHGDIILTTDFQRYVKEKRFRVYLCRKADPESKGKIENVVKYIKHNFAKYRVYDTLEDWNERAWQWLERTGNYKVHHSTKKRPFEVFLLEKQHLRKVSSSLSLSESQATKIITRNVNKDNTVRFESNRYSVPIGTYNKIKSVQIHVNDRQLLMIDTSSGELIAEHTRCVEKGKLIKNTHHRRDRSTSLEQLKQKVIDLFVHEEAISYIETVCDTYGRYRRDQLTLLQKVALENPEWIDPALKKCVKEKLYSANDFRDVVAFLKREQKETVIEAGEGKNVSISIPVQTRDLKEYVHRMGGLPNE